MQRCCVEALMVLYLVWIRSVWQTPCCHEFRMHLTDQCRWLIIAHTEREEHVHMLWSQEKVWDLTWLQENIYCTRYDHRCVQRNEYIVAGNWEAGLILCLCLSMTSCQHNKASGENCIQYHCVTNTQIDRHLPVSTTVLCCLVSSAYDELSRNMCLWHIFIQHIWLKYQIQLVYADMSLMALIINQSKHLSSIQIALGNRTAQDSVWACLLVKGTWSVVVSEV